MGLRQGDEKNILLLPGIKPKFVDRPERNHLDMKLALAKGRNNFRRLGIES
jgi:hypothetical protein